MLRLRQVLYISYNGMLDPLGQSQVIPYLKELSKLGVRFTLLSYEREQAYETEGSERCRLLREELSAFGIEWHYLRYHQRPSVPATAFDVAAGVRLASRLVRDGKIEMVHARAHIPAVIALALKRRFGVKMIFDVRGLMAEEYVDANHWREGGIPYRLTKAMERRALRAADGVVTLTEKIWPVIRNWEGLRDREVIHEVVPCCADLELFRFSDGERAAAKAKLNLQDRFVLVYSGSVGGWYLADKMADFFVALARLKTNSHFLWLTGGSGTLIEKLMTERGLSADQFTVRAVPPLDVPKYLSAADVGIAFYKPTLSRLATSPVKLAEYLACGLPVVINAGVGDSDTLMINESVGAVVKRFDESEYEQAISTIDGMVCSEARQRARKVAEQCFDVRALGVERYARLYEKLLDRAN